MAVRRNSVSSDKSKSVAWEELVSNEGVPVSSRVGGYKRRAKNGKMAVLAAFLSVLFLGGTTFHYMTEAYGANIGRAKYFQERSQYKNLVEKLETSKTEAGQLMMNCSVSVEDTDLCVQLEAALDAAERVDVSGCQEIDPYEVSPQIVEHESECLLSKNALIEKTYKELEKRIKPVHEAVGSKSVDDYKKILTSSDNLLEQARALIEETEGSVVSTSLWRRAGEAADALEKKLEEVRAVDADSLRDYTAVTQEVRQLVDALQSSMDALRQDHERWVRDQELAQARQQSSQTNTQNSSQQNGQNTPVQPTNTPTPIVTDPPPVPDPDPDPDVNSDPFDWGYRSVR